VLGEIGMLNTDRGPLSMAEWSVFV
jgi:hypothetical protein